VNANKYVELFHVLPEALHVFAAVFITVAYLVLIGLFCLWLLDASGMLVPLLRLGVFLVYFASAVGLVGMAFLMNKKKEVE